MSGSRKIKDLPYLQRPREKALHYGIETLSEIELLALLIGKGTEEKNAVEVAQALLDRHISLTNLYRIKDPRLLMVNGIGKVKALTILAVFELNKRVLYLEDNSESLRYDELKVVRAYQKKIGRLQKETLYLLSLSRRNVILSEKQLYIGSERGFTIDTKEVMRELLLSHADRYVLIHNHPSGYVEPSHHDLETTRLMASYSEKFGVELYDHLIIAANTHYSIKRGQKL